MIFKIIYKETYTTPAINNSADIQNKNQLPTISPFLLPLVEKMKISIDNIDMRI